MLFLARKHVAGWYRLVAGVKIDTYSRLQVDTRMAKGLNLHTVVDDVTANVELGLGLNSVDVAEAMKAQSELYQAFADFIAPYDALICPTASVSPIAKGELYPTEINGQPLETYISWLAITYGLTLVGHPVVVLPCGLDHRGMPFGIQVVGKYGRDRELLGLARSLEAALAGSPAASRPRPDLERLASSDPA